MLISTKSYTWLTKLSNSVISWESKEQKTVSLSNTEAEYMAISKAYLLAEFTGDLPIYVRLFNNNQSAQKLSVNHMFHKRSKHSDVPHHFIREKFITEKLIKVECLHTAHIPANALTFNANI